MIFKKKDTRAFSFVAIFLIGVFLNITFESLSIADSSPSTFEDDSLHFDTYVMFLEIDTDKGQLKGELTHTYKNKSQQALKSLRFRSDVNFGSKGSFKIASVQDAKGRELPWKFLPFEFGKLKSDKAQVEVLLIDSLNPKDQVEVKIVFSFKDKRMVNPEMVLLQDDPYLSFDAWYPKAMTKNNDSWSLNDDRPSRYEVSVVFPSNIKTLASTGSQEGPFSREGKNLFKLSAKGVRGFTLFTSPKWKRYHRKVGDLELSVLLPDEAREWATPILDSTADTVQFYRSEYGMFPTKHIDIICPGSLKGKAHGGSAACNTLTIWLSTQFEKQYRWLIAHEVAHQYFGQLLGIERREIAWAPIGLGMMLDHHYAAQRGIDLQSFRKTFNWYYSTAYKRGFDTTLSQPLEKPLKADFPWSSGWNMSLMHGKAFRVCTMLKELLGEERFKNVIIEIIKTRRGSILKGDDFVSDCEKAYGKSLDWFVADWIDGRGMADYSVKAVKKVKGGWEVEILNLGDASFPVWVEAYSELGKKQRLKVDRTKLKNKLVFKTLKTISRIVVDSESICPDKDRTNNSWESKSTKSESGH